MRLYAEAFWLTAELSESGRGGTAGEEESREDEVASADGEALDAGRGEGTVAEGVAMVAAGRGVSRVFWDRARG